MPTELPVDARMLTTLRRIVTVSISSALLLPLAIIVAFAAWNVDLHGRMIDEELQSTARALSLAIDRDVGSVISAAGTLASSPHLDTGDLARFYDRAKTISRPFGGWVVLTDQSGRQLVNTRRPFGGPLPATNVPDLSDRVFSEGKPVVSNLHHVEFAGEDIVTVLVPVFRNNDVLYCVEMTFEPDRFSALLAEQRLPFRWYALLIDGGGVQIGRSFSAQAFMKVSAPEWMLRGSDTEDERVIEGRGLAGYDVRIALHRSRFTGWAVGVAAPADVLADARGRLSIAAASGIAACIAFAFAVGLIAETRLRSLIGFA